MLSDDDKVPANSKALKKIRKDLGWGLTRVENELKALKERGEVSAAPGKSTVDRMENGDGALFPVQYFYSIARAYGIDPILIIASETPQKFLEVTAPIAKVGRDLHDAMRASDRIIIELEDEPGDVKCQQAVLNLADYADTRQTINTEKDKLMIDFSKRKIIEDLRDNGFGIYMAKSKQIAPFDVIPDENGEVHCNFTLVSSRPNFFMEHFDGIGICDVLILKICHKTEDFIKFQHDMDPAGFANDNPNTSMLWEQLARMSIGETVTDNFDVKELALEDFISPRARELEIERREIEANWERKVREKSRNNHQQLDF